MTDFTKKAIQNSFMKLLNEKPLKQISVRDIVDDCGINRNTFYYHFQDIPELMESMIREGAENIIAEHPRINSIEECLNAVIGLGIKYQRAILHVYKSINRDLFEQYQWHICDYVVTTFFDEFLKEKNISDKDRSVLTTYVKCLSFGVVIGWLEDGLKDDIQETIHRLCELKQGELDRIIEMCQTK